MSAASNRPPVEPLAEEAEKTRGPARKAALVVSFTLLMPFVMVWQSLRAIWADRASRGILITAAWLLLAGTVIFMIIEGFSLIDSFYFCFITLATIGYGDITPTTDLGKLVTVVYGIAGLGIIAALAGAIASQRLRSEPVVEDQAEAG